MLFKQAYRIAINIKIVLVCFTYMYVINIKFLSESGSLWFSNLKKNHKLGKNIKFQFLWLKLMIIITSHPAISAKLKYPRKDMSGTKKKSYGKILMFLSKYFFKSKNLNMGKYQKQ